MASRIEDYAMIGNCETAALVGRDGSIDWMCLPRFDSGACFAALLGAPEHGRWKLAPAGTAKQTKRRYRKDTLVLETEFETEQGSVLLIDFMPLRKGNSQLVRLVRGLRGEVDMVMELVLRFDYGQLVPWVTRLEDDALRAVAGPNMVVLRTSEQVCREDLKTVSKFTVREGQMAWFVLSHAASHLPVPAPIDPEEALSETDAFWKEWTARCSYRGPYEEAVKRLLITLKGLTYWPTGGIAAGVRQEIHEDVCRNGFNPALGSFVQFYGSKNLDASLLMIPKTGFLPASDARVQGTIRTIEEGLIRDGFVQRYHTSETEDGLPPSEGVFLPCSFWLADAYALSGRMKDARDLFERLLSLTNDVGLLSEEYGPESKRLVGNFPQAFSHVALVRTAFMLDPLRKE